MDFAEKTSVWTFIFLICELQSARCKVTLTHNSSSEQADTFICGTNTKFTCKIDPAPVLMSWVKDNYVQTDCKGASDTCFDDSKDNYQFTSDVDVNEFYLTVNHVMLSNAGTFTCSNGAFDDDSKTISIAAVPNAITMTLESDTGTITLQATTDCAFPMSNVSIEWYYLKELTDTPQLYTDTGFSPVRTEDSSTCTSGDCTSGADVSKVVSTVTFDEKGSGSTSAYLQAKMVHSAAPLSSPAVVAITANKYIIIEASTQDDDNGLSTGKNVRIVIPVVIVVTINIVVAILVFRKLPYYKNNIVWKKPEESDRRRQPHNDTSTNDVGTGSSPKNASTKLQEKKKVSKSPGKADNANKEKHASAKQHQHDDQPQPQAGANISRDGSGSVVSGRDVEVHETDNSFVKSQLPNKHSPGHDKKGRGLSANFGDDYHPLVVVDIQAQKAGTLPTLEDTPREDKKKTKKKKKKSKPEDKKEDSKKTETAIDF